MKTFKEFLNESPQSEEVVRDLNGSGIRVQKQEKKMTGAITLHLKSPYNKFKVSVNGEITVYKDEEEVLWLPKGSDIDKVIDIIKKL